MLFPATVFVWIRKKKAQLGVFFHHTEDYKNIFFCLYMNIFSSRWVEVSLRILEILAEQSSLNDPLGVFFRKWNS